MLADAPLFVVFFIIVILILLVRKLFKSGSRLLPIAIIIAALAFGWHTFAPSGSSDDNPYTEEEYERLAEEGDFEDIEDYRGTDEGYNYVFITPTGSCYHTIDCETLEDTLYVKPYKLGQTPDGYDPCSVCDPWQWE